MAATLTEAMLNDLHKGNACIKLLARNEASLITSVDDLDFSDADQIFSVKDTFNIQQAEATTTELKIDQGDKTIDTTDEKGEFNLNADVPSVAKALLDYFFSKVDTTERSIKVFSSSAADYKGYGYSTEIKKVKCYVAVVSESKKTSIIFTNMQFTAIFTNNDKLQVIKVKGTVLSSGITGVDDFYVVKKIAA